MSACWSMDMVRRNLERAAVISGWVPTRSHKGTKSGRSTQGVADLRGFVALCANSYDPSRGGTRQCSVPSRARASVFVVTATPQAIAKASTIMPSGRAGASDLSSVCSGMNGT